MSDTPPQRFRILADRDVRVIELAISDEIESLEFDAINTSLAGMVAKHETTKWVLDLSRVGYAGSALLGLLINLRSAVRRRSGTLVVCCMDAQIERVLRTGSMERLFVIVDNRDDAMGSF